MSDCLRNIDKVPVVILCGGSSKRMGKDKGSLPFGNVSMLQFVENRFAEKCQQMVVVAGSEQESVATLSTNTTVIRDRSPGLGPIEGLRTGLEYASQYSAFAVVATCDSPLVNLDVFDLMAQRISAEDDAVIPVIEGRPFPLTALYRSSVFETVAQMIHEGDLKVRNIMKRIRCQHIDKLALQQVDPNLETFENINTPDDYRALIDRTK